MAKFPGQTWFCLIMLWILQVTSILAHQPAVYSKNATTLYHFKVQTMRITRLCNTKEIVTVNGKYPGPVIYVKEDDQVIVTVSNKTPYNMTIHWHGVKQMLSCWYDGPSYITQCPIQPGQSFTYNFKMVQQKGTFFWHAHVSWLRATVHGALVAYPKAGIPNSFKQPFEEHIIILGEYWLKDVVQLEQQVLGSGGAPPPPDAFTINGQPGPNYNCSHKDAYKINVLPGKTYLLRLINAGLSSESFFTIASHKLVIVEADGEYTKPFTTERLMLVPGQTMIILVTADQPIGRYSIAMGPYVSAKKVKFQNVSAIAYFQYQGALPNSVSISAKLPDFNDNLAVKTFMDGLRSLNPVGVPQLVDTNLFVTIGVNVNKCNSQNPKKDCQGDNNGRLAASMNNISFIKPNVSFLEAYYRKLDGYFTMDFPKEPVKFYDFVNGAPNNIPKDTQAMNGTRALVLEYGSRVQLIFQNTGTVTTENHPIHLHGYSFYVVGYGTGNYNQQTAQLNLVDPPYMNTIGVPAGGWASIRFVSDNPGVWFMHCHFDIHQSWGLSTVLIVKNGDGELETLPQPPPDLPKC